MTIKTLPAYHVASVRHVGPFSELHQAFTKLMTWAGPKGLATGTVLGLYWDDPEKTEASKLRSDAAVTVPKGTEAEGDVQLQDLSAGRYAVHHCEVRNNDFGTPWGELGKWVMEQGHKNASQRPAYEIYYNDASQDPEGKWIVDLCMPIE